MKDVYPFLYRNRFIGPATLSLYFLYDFTGYYYLVGQYDSYS